MSLSGKSIVVTRDATQAKPFVNLLEKNHADVFLFPTIKLTDPDNTESIKKVVSYISDFHWIIFTSAIAVRFFMKHVTSADLTNTKCACVGNKTAEELKNYDLPASLIPKKNTSRDLLAEMTKIEIKNNHILIPCSNLSSDDLKSGLEKAGAFVEKISIYKNIPLDNPTKKDLQNKIENKMIDCLTFFSPSAINSFVQLMGQKTIEKINNQKIPIAVIGSTTETALIDHELIPAIKPDKSDNESMVNVLVDHFSIG